MKLKLVSGSFDDRNNILFSMLLGMNPLVIRRGHWKKTPFQIHVTSWREEGGFLQVAAAFAFIGSGLCWPQPVVPYCVLTARASEDKKSGEKDLTAAAFAVLRRRVIATIEAISHPSSNEIHI
jgi:hypothetical protein